MSTLMLLAVCLVSFGAQTTPVLSLSTPMPPIQTSLPIFSPTASAPGVIMLELAVRSYTELNQTTVTPLLEKLKEIINAQQPGLNFTLSVRSVTKV